MNKCIDCAITYAGNIHFDLLFIIFVLFDQSRVNICNLHVVAVVVVNRVSDRTHQTLRSRIVQFIDFHCRRSDILEHDFHKTFFFSIFF